MPALTPISLAQRIAEQRSLSAAIDRAQVRVATGHAVTKPSDDPAAWVQLSRFGRAAVDADAFLSARRNAQATAQHVDGALTVIGDDLAKAREILVAAGGVAARDAVGRTALKAELIALSANIAQTLAQQHDGTPLFAQNALQMDVAHGHRMNAAPDAATIATVSGTGRTLPAILTDAVQALDNPAMYDAALSDMAHAIDHIATQHGVHGLRMAKLSTLDAEADTAAVSRSEQASALRDADIAEELTRIATLQTQRDAARNLFASVNRSSLFDLLR